MDPSPLQGEYSFSNPGLPNTGKGSPMIRGFSPSGTGRDAEGPGRDASCLRPEQQTTLLKEVALADSGMRSPAGGPDSKNPESLAAHPRKQIRNSKASSRFNKDIQNLLPGRYAGGLLEAIAFEQLLAHGVVPGQAPELVEKSLLSISPTIDSDGELVVLVETQRAAVDGSAFSSPPRQGS